MGFIIREVPHINIIENISVKGIEFQGNRATFSISFSNDVKSITFYYKDVKQKVNLLDKKSPYSFSCYLPLNIGDNYIEITAEDRFGNSFDTLPETDNKLANMLFRTLYYVNMVRTKDYAPDININICNNVDANIW